MVAVIVKRSTATNYVYNGLIIDAFGDANEVEGRVVAGVVNEVWRVLAGAGTNALQFGFRSPPPAVIFNGSTQLTIWSNGATAQVRSGSTLEVQGDRNSGIILRNGLDAMWATHQTLAAASASLTLTTTPTAITGTSTVVTATGDNARFHATGTFDCNWTAAGATTAVGGLQVDGVTQSGSAFFESNAADTPRVTIYQQWGGTLTSGAHTFELVGSKNIAAGTVAFASTHTKLSVTVFE